ncbi:hypothetical protein [Streptomyces sp. NPDC059009]|uniref:hypothetical protein n=1 Tax=Streptomyces sp. NPDC059009 TaxID=3346694 RepID=UPI003676092C
MRPSLVAFLSGMQVKHKLVLACVLAGFAFLTVFAIGDAVSGGALTEQEPKATVTVTRTATATVTATPGEDSKPQRKPESKPKPEPTPTPEPTTTPTAQATPSRPGGSGGGRPAINFGRFCAPVGAIGTTLDGRPAKCFMGKDGRARWGYDSGRG